MGANTLYGYFYKPSLGASGAAELALFDAKLDIADAAIKANLDGLTTKQPLDTALTNISALVYASASFIKLTANDTYAVRTLSEVRTDLGLVISTDVAEAGANDDITSLTGLTTPLGTAYGGTGVANNAASTLTISGSFGLTLTIGEATSVTLPASGTLATTAVTTLSSLTSIGTIATGMWEATDIGLAHGGTGVSTGAMVNFTSILNAALYIGRDADNQIKFATDNNIIFRLNGVDGALFNSTGELDMNAHTIGFTLQTATGDGTDDIDWKLGNKMKLTLPAGNETLTFTAPTNPCNLMLHIVQDGVGGRDVTFPASVKWLGTEPTWSDGGASKNIVMSMWYDGTNYWSQGTSWET